MEKKYPLFDIYWNEDDVNSVSKVIKRGSYWATGPEIREFEKELESYLGIKYAVTFNSGTSALHSVLLSYDICSGEVIVPSLSFIATANCVVLAGAKPVFADIEDETLGLDLEDVQEKINNKTKAIIPMHYGGRPSKNIESLRDLAEDYNLLLIEDNAESLGAKINGKYTGTFGNASILSFCQNKIITTGEGGAVCTNNEDIYKRLLLIRSHGRVEKEGDDYFSNIKEMDYIDLGYNFRIPTMCAALGLSQLEKIDEIIELRREKGKYYDEILKNIPQIEILPELKNSKNVYQLYTIKLNRYEYRSELQNFLKEKGIITKIYFYPIHLKTYYKNKFGYREGFLPKTENISKKLLTLPFSLLFEAHDQEYIKNMIGEFYNK